MGFDSSTLVKSSYLSSVGLLCPEMYQNLLELRASEDCYFADIPARILEDLVSRKLLQAVGLARKCCFSLELPFAHLL